MITRPGETLFIHLREIAASTTQELIDAGFYDPVKEGPDVEKIEAVVKPFLDTGQHTPLPDEKLTWIIERRAVQAGTAFQALGNLDSETAERALEKVLKEGKNEDARKAALYALGDSDSPAALKILQGCTYSPRM